MFPSPEDLPHPGLEPRPPASQVDSLPVEPPEKPSMCNGEIQRRQTLLEKWHRWTCLTQGCYKPSICKKKKKGRNKNPPLYLQTVINQNRIKWGISININILSYSLAVRIWNKCYGAKLKMTTELSSPGSFRGKYIPYLSQLLRHLHSLAHDNITVTSDSSSHLLF